MAFACQVKNTFLTIKLDTAQADPALHRSSSVPRAFKPCGVTDCKWEDDTASITTDGGFPESCQSVLTDLDYQDSLKHFDDGSDSPSYHTPSEYSGNSGERWADCEDSDDDTSKVTLSLADMVKPDKPKGRSKLRSSAQLFKSVAVEPPDEVKLALSQMAANVTSFGEVCDVQVQEGCMGGVAMVTCQTCDASANSASILNSVKHSLLCAAAESENTYVMGYNSQPFTDLDAFSFSASIGCVPAAHRDTACWDTYMTGFCPRPGKCRWAHPGEMDVMRCIVVVKDA